MLKTESNCTKLELHNQVCMRYENAMKNDHLKNTYFTKSKHFFTREKNSFNLTRLLHEAVLKVW